MARHTIPIANGSGTIKLVTGTYNAQAVAGGYDSSTLNPTEVTILDGTDTYAFTISANGTLTLHVTDTGLQSGVGIIGAKFIRTDSMGTIVGKDVVTNSDGNAVFLNVPYAQSGSNTIYYKQISSDGGHTFDDSVKSVTMTEESQTIEIQNPDAPVRNFTLMDASFPNIPVMDGQVILEDK